MKARPTLELAAARVRMLTVEQIAIRLENRFGLLRAGSRTAPPRHQTLRGAIDWSYALLPEPARALFRRLSVFAGGWPLEAAEVVGGFPAHPPIGGGGQGPSPSPSEGPPPERAQVLDRLAALVDKSLVVAETAPTGGTGEARYRLLETLAE